MGCGYYKTLPPMPTMKPRPAPTVTTAASTPTMFMPVFDLRSADRAMLGPPLLHIRGGLSYMAIRMVTSKHDCWCGQNEIISGGGGG